MKKGNETVLTLLYRLFSTVSFSCAVILYFPGFFGMAGGAGKHFAVLFCMIAVLLCIGELNKRQRIYAILICVPVGVFLSVLLGKEKMTVWLFAENRFLWTIVLAAAVCGLQHLSEKYFFVKIISAVFLCAFLLYSLFTEWHIPKMSVWCQTIYLVMTLTEYIRQSGGRKGRENSQAYLMWVMPFLGCYFGILLLMPAPKTPYSWQWFKDICLRAEEKITIYMDHFAAKNQEDLDGAISGFSEKAALFSNLDTDNKNLMTIGTAPGKKPSLYLSGKIFDTFDGREWKSTVKGDAQESVFDTIETVYALARYGQNDPVRPIYYSGAQVNAKYRNFHTNYLLTPAKTWEIEAASGYRQSGADLVFEKKAGYGTTYTFRYCRVNMGREAMRDFLRSDLQEDTGLWKRTVKQYAEEKITSAAFDEYRENVRRRYLQEMPLLPETEEWLAAVTKDAENDTDRLFCIEEALADMKYNTEAVGLPADVTDGQAFLNYFLTKGQEGFCSHYATAFVLLARAEGFPARYVQGFCVPMQYGEETEVYSNMAHAWPEVYVEGKGWIPFEPTPGYDVRRYVAEKESRKKKDSDAETKQPAETKAEVDEDVTFEEQVEEAEEAKRRERIEEMRKTALLIAMCAALFCMTGALLLLIDRLGERYREKRRSIAEKYRRAVARNLQILSMIGYEREDFETYQELLMRIRKEDEEQKIPTAFIETYESILYGTREAGEQELEECREKEEELICILRKKKKGKYIFYRIRLGMM